MRSAAGFHIRTVPSAFATQMASGAASTTASSVWLDSRRARVSCPRSIARRSTDSRCSTSTGLTRYANAEPSIARIAVGSEACPVMTMTSVAGEAVLIACSTSRPDMSGSMMSRIAASVGALTSCSSAARARWNTRTWYPRSSSTSESVSQMPGSSSTMSTPPRPVTRGLPAPRPAARSC